MKQRTEEQLVQAWLGLASRGELSADGMKIVYLICAYRDKIVVVPDGTTQVAYSVTSGTVSMRNQDGLTVAVSDDHLFVWESDYAKLVEITTKMMGINGNHNQR